MISLTNISKRTGKRKIVSCGRWFAPQVFTLAFSLMFWVVSMSDLSCVLSSVLSGLVIRQILQLISSPDQRCTMQKPPLIELRRNGVKIIFLIHFKINSMDIVKVSSWDNLPEKKEFRNNSILRRRQLRGKEYMLRIINLRFQGIEYCGKGVLPCSTLIYTDKPWTGLKCDYKYELFNFCDFSRVQNYGTPIKYKRCLCTAVWCLELDLDCLLNIGQTESFWPVSKFSQNYLPIHTAVSSLSILTVPQTQTCQS